MNKDVNSWERLHRKQLFTSDFLTLFEDTVKLPNGVQINDYTVANLPSGVVVVATDGDNKLITQYEYKYAIDKTILNLPSGGIEGGEGVIEVARRELLEETGYVSNDMECIRTLYEYPSKLDHVIYVVRAKNARKLQDVRHEETEFISEVHLITPKDINSEVTFNTTYNISALALTLPEYLR